MLMKPIDILVIAIIAVILGLVIWYIHRSKKKGIKCIGCPDSATCGGKCSGSCSGCSGCGSHSGENEL